LPFGDTKISTPPTGTAEVGTGGTVGAAVDGTVGNDGLTAVVGVGNSMTVVGEAVPGDVTVGGFGTVGAIGAVARWRTVKRALIAEGMPCPSVVTARNRSRTLVPHGAWPKRTGDRRSTGWAADQSVQRTPLSTLKETS